MGGKMYKVWNCSRTVKKSLVAASLTELLRKGSEKLGYAGAGAVTVVLEEDGTRVEDDEYFELLEPNTTFILLTAGETWQPAWQTVPFNQHTVAAAAAEDTVDHGAAAAAAADVTSIAHLAEILRSDLTRLVTFSTQQLQELASASPGHLASLLGPAGGPGGEERGAEAIIACCQRHLDAQLEADEAITLLRSLKAAATGADTQGAGEGNGQGDGDVTVEREGEEGPGAEKRQRLDT